MNSDELMGLNNILSSLVTKGKFTIDEKDEILTKAGLHKVHARRWVDEYGATYHMKKDPNVKD